MQRIILWLATFLMPMHAMALTMADLTPGQDDATMRIFAYIFGNIGGIFPGAPETTVIGDMFYI